MTEQGQLSGRPIPRKKIPTELCQALCLTSDDKGKEEHGVEVAPSLTQLGVTVVGLPPTRTWRPPAPYTDTIN